MNRKKYMLFALVMLMGLLVSGVFACSTGPKLKGQAEEIQSLNADIHDRAYRCAPKEIAVAESNI
ncbi:MAG: hypothetical protein ACLFVJ_06815, partial [Persicimonas sp.]